MLINQIINVEVTAGESPPTSEPVTVQEVKDYLRTGGFIPNEGSPADDFSFDDDLIGDMIAEGRNWAEKFIGGDDYMHSILPRSIEVVLLNQAGRISLPGPSRSNTIAIEDFNESVISNAVFIGGQWPKLHTCYRCQVRLNYNVGYTIFPEWVKNAIKAYVADHYTHRGDEELLASNQRAKDILRPHIKIPAWG